MVELADTRVLEALAERLVGSSPAPGTTRLRFCSADGTMDFDVKESADDAPPGLLPWFNVPGRQTADVPIAFGHWSTLGTLDRPRLLPLDTGCVWGGSLTAARIDPRSPLQRELISVRCDRAQRPG